MAGAPPDPAFGEAICAALRAQVAKLGLSIAGEPAWGDVRFSEQEDPYSGCVSLVAAWRGGARDGKVIFFPGGRVFAEYQVLLPHPAQSDSYVESVQVWGTAARLCGDAVVARYAE